MISRCCVLPAKWLPRLLWGSMVVGAEGVETGFDQGMRRFGSRSSSCRVRKDCLMDGFVGSGWKVGFELGGKKGDRMGRLCLNWLSFWMWLNSSSYDRVYIYMRRRRAMNSINRDVVGAFARHFTVIVGKLNNELFCRRSPFTFLYLSSIL